MADFKQIKSIQISKMGSQHGSNAGKVTITLQVEGASEVSKQYLQKCFQFQDLEASCS